jgi:hypothetical protein
MHTGFQASFLGIELSVYLVFASGLYLAVRRGRLEAMSLLAACLLGFLAEVIFATPIEALKRHLPVWLATAIAHARDGSDNYYTYPSDAFLIMVADIPLWVILGWASIIHASRRTAAALGFGPVLGPLAAGLLAATIDFALDPLANALGYWTWVVSHSTSQGLLQVFGVPFDNYLGWMMIVGGLSLTLDIACDLSTKWGSRMPIQVACLLGAVIGAFGIVVVVQSLYDWLYTIVWPAGTFFLIYGAIALLTVTRLPWLRRDAAIDVWPLGVAAVYHVYLGIMLFTHPDVYDHSRTLLAYTPLVSSASLIAFAWPSCARLLERWRERRAKRPLEIEPAPAQPLR